jgi:hypothetical protein
MGVKNIFLFNGIQWWYFLAFRTSYMYDVRNQFRPRMQVFFSYFLRVDEDEKES